jgi:hypothetical protein
MREAVAYVRRNNSLPERSHVPLKKLTASLYNRHRCSPVSAFAFLGLAVLAAEGD